MRHCLHAFTTFVLTLVLTNSYASTTYKSEIDNLLTIRTVTLLPVFDNIRGIYARPIETHLIDYLSKSHSWEYLESNYAGPIMTPEEIESDPNAVLTIADSVQADAFISAGVIRGPQGVGIKMSMYLKKDRRLIAQESEANIKSFDVTALKRQSEKMMKSLFAKLPYRGLVMSRQGTRVTVNLGRLDGLEENQVLTVIHIIKATRHPKFGFVVSTEKELIGKIKILKIDDTLSFGRIVTEKESGAITVNAKVASTDSVVYADADTLSEDSTSPESLADRPDGKVSYGSSPSQWLPTRKPTFGMAGAKIGVGNYTENVQSSSSLDAKSPYYPMVAIEGELWLTPTWSMHANMRQGIITTDNPVSGGQPSELSHSMSAYDFLFGYNMRLGASISAPKVEILFGYATYRMYVDESTPAGLTTKTYSGPKAGVSGYYPMPGKSPYSVGANLMFMFSANMKESPSTSGNADNSVNSFGLFVDKELNVNLKARFGLDFELYSSDFSSTTTTSASQKHTTLSAGLYYLF